MPRKSASRSKARKASANTVSALVRGIEVLRCFEPGAALLSHGDIARRTGIPKPTVTRLVATLVSLGLLRQMPDSDAYGLSAGVLTLAQAFLSSMDLRSCSRPHMKRLAESADAAVYLAVRDGLDMVLIEACRSEATMLRTRVNVGSRLTLATAAAGRAYLSGLDAPARDALLAQLRQDYADNWKSYASGLNRALKDAALHGYALSAGEWHPDINTVALPLRTAEGELVALTCGGPAFAFPAARLRASIAPRLFEAANAIAREIGGSLPLARPAVQPGLRRSGGAVRQRERTTMQSRPKRGEFGATQADRTGAKP